MEDHPFTKSLNDVEGLKAVGPPIRHRLSPPNVKTPNVKGYRKAQVQNRDENWSPELLEQNTHKSGLKKYFYINRRPSCYPALRGPIIWPMNKTR